MPFIAKFSPEWSLRVGLGLMYLYSGIDIMRHPTGWFWAVRPLAKFLPFLGSSDAMIVFLRGQATVELVFAVSLLGWFWSKSFVRIAVGLSVLQMFGILILLPLDAVTFRDIGLLGAGLALFLILSGAKKFSQDKEVLKSSLPAPVTAGGPVVQTFDEFMGKK